MFTPMRLKFLALSLALAGSLIVAPAAALTTAPAPVPPLNFTLRTADGGEISSQMLRGDVVVLAFGASWLPLSRRQVEGVQKLSDQYSERNVRVYWVSVDSDQPKSKNYATDNQLRDFAKRNGLKVGVLRDPGGSLLKEVGVDQLPALIILDRQGNVAGQPVGGLNPEGNLADQLAPRLNRLLGGE